MVTEWSGPELGQRIRHVRRIWLAAKRFRGSTPLGSAISTSRLIAEGLRGPALPGSPAIPDSREGHVPRAAHDLPMSWDRLERPSCLRARWGWRTAQRRCHLLLRAMSLLISLL